MKLASPRELNTKIQEQKSSEVRAGMFLAKKVDSLREEVQTAQVEHDRAIEGMKADFAIFMTEQSLKRGIVLKEIEELTEKRRLLMIPFDEEWKKVNEISLENVEKSKANLVAEDNLKEREKTVSKRETESEKASIQAKETLAEAENIKKKTVDVYVEVTAKSKDFQEYKKQTDEEIKIRTKTVTKRETDVAYREIDVENNLKIIDSEKEAVRNEREHIASQRETLKTAFAELKKKKNASSN